MDSIKRIGSNGDYSEAVVFENIIHISGQVDYKQSRTVAEQTAEILKTIDNILAEAGSSKENLLRVTVYLANAGDFEEMDNAWRKWIVTGREPARTVQQSQFSNPGWLVKIAAVAAVKDWGDDEHSVSID